MINSVFSGGSASSKVGVSGDSGGGSHAASVAHDVPGVGFQVRIRIYHSNPFNRGGEVAFFN